jgi:hypothetical protein
MATATRECDIQMNLGGFRAAWWAVSEAGHAWADAHRTLAEAAPEGIECLSRFCDPLIEQALRDGLVVMAGDVEVTLCS